MFGIPLALFPLLAGIYLHGVVREMPVAVFDGDQSELSRMVIRYLDASSAFHVVGSASSVDEIQALFRRGEIKAACCHPRKHGAGCEARRKHPDRRLQRCDESDLLANMTLEGSLNGGEDRVCGNRHKAAPVTRDERRSGPQGGHADTSPGTVPVQPHR